MRTVAGRLYIVLVGAWTIFWWLMAWSLLSLGTALALRCLFYFWLMPLVIFHGLVLAYLWVRMGNEA